MQNTVRNLPVNYDITSEKALQLDYEVSKEEVTVRDDDSSRDSSGDDGGDRNDYDDGDSSRVMEKDIGSVDMKGLKHLDDEDDDDEDDDNDDEDNERDGNKRDYYNNLNTPEDILDISDIDAYLKDRRNKLDTVFKSLLNDLKDPPKKIDSETPKSPKNRKNKNRIKIKKTHLRYPDNYEKTGLLKTKRKVMKELEKDEDEEEKREKDDDLLLHNSNNLLIKNLHKYRKILLTFIFGLIIHYSIIWGVQII
jgi:hypothetical protein